MRLPLRRWQDLVQGTVSYFLEVSEGEGEGGLIILREMKEASLENEGRRLCERSSKRVKMPISVLIYLLL